MATSARPMTSAGNPQELSLSRLRRLILQRATSFAGICLVIGAAAGWLWNRFTTLPEFVTGEDRTLAMSERSSMQFFTPDAGFVLIGLIVGIGLGVLGWYWGRRLGWPAALLTPAGGVLAGAMCWLVGWAIGPRNFDQRVAAAQPGDLVSVDFTLRSPVALLVWAIAALLPVFLYSALSGEPDRVLANADEIAESNDVVDEPPVADSRH